MGRVALTGVFLQMYACHGFDLWAMGYDEVGGGGASTAMGGWSGVPVSDRGDWWGGLWAEDCGYGRSEADYGICLEAEYGIWGGVGARRGR